MYSLTVSFRSAVFWAASLVVGISLTLTPLSLHAEPFAKPERSWAQGRILVQPKADLAAQEFDALLHRNNGRKLGKLRELGVHVVRVPPQAEEKVAAALARHPRIEFAELDMLVEPVWLPDDPKYPNQWHLPKIDAPSAWDFTAGNGVVVAVLDTGVDPDHPDLVGKLVPGWNAYDQNNDWSDVHGHGTKVAGTVAAETNNSEGVASVAPDALIMPVRISQPDGYAYWSTVASGLTWAADHGAEVANISYMVTGSYTVDQAAAYLRDKGGLVVAAAGNSGGEVLTAEDPYIISVSATSSSDVRASWSSYGAYVDLSAPGAGIVTTANGGGYASVSGTSFASPCTAAVIALMKGANPNLTPDQLETLLEGSAVDLGEAGWDPYYGYGRIDADAAVAAALEVETSDSQSPVVSIASPTGGTVSGTVTVDVSASDETGVVSVELWVAGTLHATDETSPYSFAWDTTAVADGTVELTATATDAAGNVGTSTIVQVTVDNIPDPVDDTPPSVRLFSPGEGATVEGRVKIEAGATDDVDLALLEILVDGSALCASNVSPLTCNWNTRKAADGNHVVEARGTDTAGNVGWDSVTVQVGGDSTDSTDSTKKTPPGLAKKR